MRLILDIYYPDAGKFSETEHPRGQPENKGEFVKKGSATVNAKPAGSTVKPATPTTGSAKPAPADRKNLFARFESAQKAGKSLNVAEALPSAAKGAWKSGKMATKAAIKSYLEEGYWDVNKVLRQPGSLSTVVEDTPDVLAKIDAIKAAFELPMAKATSDFVTYRGSKLTPKVMDQLKQALASGQPARLRGRRFYLYIAPARVCPALGLHQIGNFGKERCTGFIGERYFSPAARKGSVAAQWSGI